MSLRNSRSLVLVVGMIVLLARQTIAVGAGKKYAILIGVRSYESTVLNELPFAENDVSELADVLKANGFEKDNIVLMTASHATKSRKPRFSPRAKNIRRELRNYLSLPDKGDTAVIALAGHGVQLEGDKEHYFCPVDADLKNKQNLISITDLYKALDDCAADVKLLLVDACRNDPLSGDAPRSVANKVASKTRPAIAAPPGGIAAFFSCSQGQEAFESGKLKHGVFFHFVLEGLRGKAANSDRQVTIGSLTEYVSRKVRGFAVKELGAVQRPELLGRHNPSVPLVVVRKSLPKTKTVTLPSGVKLELMLVPKGTFWMSADYKNAQKQETIPHDFYIGKYEVTQEQWQAVMGNNPSNFARTGTFKSRVKDIPDSELKRFPVEWVSWEECQQFLKKVNGKNREDGWTLRLPKESEWEYICRGGATSKEACSYHFYFTKPTNSLSATQSNFDGKEPFGDAAKGPSLKRTTRVGSYEPNALGVYDMHGNVCEWCDDWYTDGFIKPGSSRVIRGGNWLGSGSDCRALTRSRGLPSFQQIHLGFRVALVPSGR